MYRITKTCALVLPTMVLCLAVSLKAQETQQPQKQQNASKTHSDDYTSGRPTKREISALEKENLSRVAAAPSQIKEVLVKEPGLLVELKRLIAKDASDNGQVVNDEDLTDNAVFDRLTSDIAFRSVATRLVQRYGYLLPSVNPDSEMEKSRTFSQKSACACLCNSKHRKMRSRPRLKRRKQKRPELCNAILTKIVAAQSNTRMILRIANISTRTKNCLRERKLHFIPTRGSRSLPPLKSWKPKEAFQKVNLEHPPRVRLCSAARPALTHNRPLP